MKTNPAGVELIKRSESLMLRAYLCPAGIPTIGWGHTGDVTHDDVARRRTITVHQAEAILSVDLEKFERGVEKLTAGVRPSLNENEFSALVSFAFNVGLGSDDPRLPGGLTRSMLLRKLKAGDRAGAAEEFAKWNHVAGKVNRGLTERRAAERALFLRTP